MKTGSILLLFLTSTLVLPLGFSAHADDQSTDTNQTTSNQTGTTTNQTAINQTSSVPTENIGLQISSFVHNATALFQQEKAENIQAIKECHQKMQNATSENRTQIIDDCHATMTAIREKYQDARTQFQQLFKQFRANIIVLRHDAEGLQVSEQDKETAMKNIDEEAAKHGLTGIKIAMEHMKGMVQNGMMGIKRALNYVNKTNETNGQLSTPATHAIPAMPALPSGESLHGPPSSPGQAGLHGKH